MATTPANKKITRAQARKKMQFAVRKGGSNTVAAPAAPTQPTAEPEKNEAATDGKTG